MTYPECLAPLESATRPKVLLPAGATDCHCHVYMQPERYPLAEPRSYTPACATLDAYLDLCKQLGLQRTVQVSASVYGFDNSLTTDVIRRLGQDRARGVAGVSPDIDAKALGQLHEDGFRGVRLSTYLKGYGGMQAMQLLAPKLRPLGWHLQIHLTHIEQLPALKNELLALPVPLVFDHMGSVRGDEDLQSPGFQTLLQLLTEREDCWVKISSWYRRSTLKDGSGNDMRPFAEKLVATRPDRVLFGTNWPHPNLFGSDLMPDDGLLLNRFCEWIPESTIQKSIFVDNPAELYGFDPV